jgi:hypothetical protein
LDVPDVVVWLVIVTSACLGVDRLWPEHGYGEAGLKE